DGIRDATVTGVQTCALPISVKKILPLIELLWQETQERLLYTGSPVISISGRIFFTAASADGEPAAALGHSSLIPFALAFARSSKIGRASCRVWGCGDWLDVW